MGFAFDLTPEMAGGGRPVMNEYAAAFLYYTALGGFDPKNPVVDAPLLARAGSIGYFSALMKVTIGGALFWGVVMFTADPLHKHSGGIDDWLQNGKPRPEEVEEITFANW